MEIVPYQLDTQNNQTPELEYKVVTRNNNLVTLAGKDLRRIYPGVILKYKVQDNPDSEVYGVVTESAITATGQFQTRLTSEVPSGRIISATEVNWWTEEQDTTTVVSNICFSEDQLISTLQVKSLIPDGQPAGRIGWTLLYARAFLPTQVVVYGNDLLKAGEINEEFLGSWLPGYYFLKLTRFSADRNIPIKSAIKMWALSEPRNQLISGGSSDPNITLDLL